MLRTRMLAPLLISTLVLAGCGGSDDADSASATTEPTGGGADGTDGADGADGTDEELTDDEVGDDSLGTADITQVPDDDGGKICEVIASVNGRFPDNGSTVALGGAQLVGTAAALEAELLPIVPAQIAEDAEMFVTQMRDAGEELLGYPDQAADPATLIDDDDLIQFGIFAGMLSPETDSGTGETYYSNYFVAWSTDPCGPKALAVDMSEFEAISGNI